MSNKLPLVAALALAAGILGPGAASAASCRDALGHFTKCAAAPAKAQQCHDAKGKFVKCSASKSAPAVTAMSTKK